MSSFSSVNPYAVLATVLFCLAMSTVLVALFGQNRLLFNCVVVALVVHGGVFGYFQLQRYLESLRPHEILIPLQVRVIKEPPPPPPKKDEPPKPKLEKVRPLDIPKGVVHKTTAKVMPKGHEMTTKPRAAAKSNTNVKPKNVSAPSHGRVLTTGVGPSGDVPDPDKGDLSSPADSLDVNDLKGAGFKTTNGTGKGKTGGDPGTPDGKGNGDIPAGFADGKVNGKVYLIRLKHGSGAWNSYSQGTNRLLSFLNRTAFKTEREARTLSADELRSRYMVNGAQPTFLYIYADDKFNLNSNEVTVLREYMDNGGFLFIDSRPDPDYLDIIQSQLAKILPGNRLQPIPNSHPINSFMYRLSVPGLGENTSGKKNYGVTKGGKLVVFYTPGNFAHFFGNYAPGTDPYFDGQYQMAANVLVYAMKKGSADGVQQLKGANTKITTQAMQAMGLLDAAPKPKPGATPESVKIQKTPVPGETPKPGGPDMPDDIKVLDN